MGQPFNSCERFMPDRFFLKRGVKIPFVDFHRHLKPCHFIPSFNFRVEFYFTEKSGLGIVCWYDIFMQLVITHTLKIIAMKKLFTLACGVALIAGCSVAHAQTEDSALARVDRKKNASKEEPAKSVTVTEGENLKQANVAPETKFVVPPAGTDRNSKDAILNNKVGPNGEELFMKKNSYYYINSDGKKVKVKKSMLKDKPKHT